MRIHKETLEKIITKIALTRADEIGCETCFAEVDRFVDMLVAGEDPEKVMPLVEHHLKVCGNCHEEFLALLEALKSAAT
ncbi:MAG: hypothetical protein HYZ26_11630 [Chloroflexi bacterium]|nr:hypothetical protein [Chloroflexota bacterium]